MSARKTFIVEKPPGWLLKIQILKRLLPGIFLILFGLIQLTDHDSTRGVRVWLNTAFNIPLTAYPIWSITFGVFYLISFASLRWLNSRDPAALLISALVYVLSCMPMIIYSALTIYVAAYVQTDISHVGVLLWCMVITILGVMLIDSIGFSEWVINNDTNLDTNNIDITGQIDEADPNA